MHLAVALGHRQQVQIVVAQHRLHAVLLVEYPAQHLQRLGAAVDQVAGEPQRVAAGVEIYLAQQRHKGRKAALQIAIA